jgi:hypothetical protein
VAERDADADDRVGVVAVYYFDDGISLRIAEPCPLVDRRTAGEIRDGRTSHQDGIDCPEDPAFAE